MMIMIIIIILLLLLLLLLLLNLEEKSAIRKLQKNFRVPKKKYSTRPVEFSISHTLTTM